MLYSIQELKSSLFFDVESTPQYKSLDDLPTNLANVWRVKYAKRCHEREVEDAKKENYYLVNSQYGDDFSNHQATAFSEDYIYTKHAALYAEFGKVLCISVGLLDDKLVKTVATFTNRDSEGSTTETEKEVLESFRIFCDSHPELKLAGFNIKGFDIPFLTKRYLINGLQLPKMLQLRNKKPWEINVLDIMEDWKGIGWDIVALETLTLSLGLKSPKEKFQNNQMNTLLIKGEISIDDCAEYCERDVHSVIDVALKLSNQKVS